MRMIPTRAQAHGASASGLPARGRGESQHFAGDSRGLKAVFTSSPPAPLAPCGLGFIVASASRTPAFHLAGEAVASWDLQTQPDDRSLKVRRDSPTGSHI